VLQVHSTNRVAFSTYKSGGMIFAEGVCTEHNDLSGASVGGNTVFGTINGKV